jgi:outer membrane protein assembly factor BamE (lipoprotein component of BamABCDE complex)
MLKIVIAAGVAVALGGCAPKASVTSGRQIAAADVQRIVKGSTTRAQVEAMFGAPAGTGMAPDGGRMAFYSFTASNSQSKVRGESMIPIVGMFYAGGDSTTQVRQQQLQVIYDASGVVKDYEFSDTTSQNSVRRDLGGTQMQQGPAVPTPEK